MSDGGSHRLHPGGGWAGVGTSAGAIDPTEMDTGGPRGSRCPRRPGAGWEDPHNQHGITVLKLFLQN